MCSCFLTVLIKPVVGTTLHNSCTIYNDTIPTHAQLLMYNLYNPWNVRSENTTGKHNFIEKNRSKTINTDEFDQIFEKYTTQNTMFREFYSFLCYRNACNLNLRISKKIEKKTWHFDQKLSVKLSFECPLEQNTTGKHNSEFQIVQYCAIHLSEILNTTQQQNYILTIVLCCVVPTTGLVIGMSHHPYGKDHRDESSSLWAWCP